MMLAFHRKTIFEILGRHPVHPFPARMAPGIALDALGRGGPQLRVLDPMAGSGTVLAVARANGHYAIGVDLDPLAVLIAHVWTQTVDVDSARDAAADVLGRAKGIFRTLRMRDAYPPSCEDEETRGFVRYWFDGYARRQLAALALSILNVSDTNVRDVLWCGFSRLIIAKQAGASLAMDLAHSRPHKAFERAPTKPFDKFLAAVTVVAENCPRARAGRVGPPANVRWGDARELAVKGASIDLVLTSPPYLNAIDYLRCSKFSLVWMGYSISQLRRIRSDSVGSEASSAKANQDREAIEVVEALALRPRLSARHEHLLLRYVSDMRAALDEASRVLRPGGKAVYVVGDSTVRGTFVRNSEIVRAVGVASGLEFRERSVRTLPANRRYLPPPKVNKSMDAALDGRMRREVVLVFSKGTRTAQYTGGADVSFESG